MSDYLKTNFDFNAPELINLFDEVPFWSAPFGIKLLEHIKYKKGIQALDIGFGTGFPLTEIAMRLGNTSKVFGIDPWDASVNRARKRITFCGIQNIEILHGVAERIALPDASIDLITSNNGLNNVQDLSKALLECNRVLKPGGQFLQTMNLNKTMMEFYAVMEEVLTAMGLPDSITKMEEQIYVKRKPLDEYIELMKKSGFKINRVNEDNFNYRFADGSAFLNYYFFRLAFMDGWKSIIPEEHQKVVFEKMEHKMNQIAEQQSGFKVHVPFVLIDSRLA